MDNSTIKFVNHSSFIISNGDIRLICDPWLEKPVFHNGWDLLAPSKFENSDFKDITHIWISHEHPDHFHPPTLSKIKQEDKSKIIVLYHKTYDKKVINWLKKCGFKEVIEMIPDKWINLSKNFKIQSNPFGNDSWLCIKTNDMVILNTNDCMIRTPAEAKKIKKKVGDVSVLLTQFSYGQYEGNKDNPELRKIAAKKKIKQMENEINIFKPKNLIPMASFIFFCHEENYYMNDCVNTIEYVFEYFNQNKNVIPIILYIDDEWYMNKNHNSLNAISNWKLHTNSIKNRATVKTVPIPLKSIKEAHQELLIRTKNKRHIYELHKKIEPLIIRVNDYQKTFKFSLNALQETFSKSIDLEVSSEVLFFCIKYDWGFNTTHVNGRIQFFNDGFNKFIYYEWLHNQINHNRPKISFYEKIIDKFKRRLMKK